MRNALKFKIRDLYYIALVIYTLSLNIQLSYMYNGWAASQSGMLLVLKAMHYGAYLLCLIRLAGMKRVGRFPIFFAAALFVSSVYATYTGIENAPVFHCILLACAIDTDFKKLTRIFFGVQLSTMIVYMLLALTRISGWGYFVEGSRVRYFLGYGWVNRASYCWFFLCLEYLYLKNGRLRIFEGLIGAVVALYLYIKTRTSFSLMLTALVIAYGVYKQIESLFMTRRRRSNPRVFAVVCMGAFLFTVLLGVLLPLIYDPGNPLLSLLNRLSNGRVELGSTAIARYGLHLGGNHLQWVGASSLLFGIGGQSGEYFYVDNGFLQMALEYGVLFTGFIIFVYLGSIWKSALNRDYPMTMCMLILGALYVFEPYVIDFAFNPFILYYFSNIGIRAGVKRKAGKTEAGIESEKCIQARPAE